MNTKTKNRLAIVLFILVFGILLLSASFADLDVSRILTKNVLPDGQYYTNDAFGAFLECVGSIPKYLVTAFALQILACYALRFFDSGKKRIAAALFCSSGGYIPCFAFFNQTSKYILQHLTDGKAEHTAFLNLIVIFMSLVFNALIFAAVRGFSDGSIKKLVGFSLACLFAVGFAFLSVHIIKAPMGRMRFRAMNTPGGKSVGGFDNFTRWYAVNGQRWSREEMLALFGTADACKSFPSGHTASAGASYCLIMLPDALGIKNRRLRAALWLVPIIFTGAVAVSRIAVGAHFFSDVLIGGTLSFVSVVVFREIFIQRGQNIKAMLGRGAGG